MGKKPGHEEVIIMKKTGEEEGEKEEGRKRRGEVGGREGMNSVGYNLT